MIEEHAKGLVQLLDRGEDALKIVKNTVVYLSMILDYTMRLGISKYQDKTVIIVLTVESIRG